MKTKSLLILAVFILSFSVTAQVPSGLLTGGAPLRNSSTAKIYIAEFLQKYDFLLALTSNSSTNNCAVAEFAFAPQAACNGASITPITFSNASRTTFTGTPNTVGVVYKYTNVGTTPDGTVLDALVTVVSYSNNQDSNQTNFRDADTTAVGFDGNLQPSIEQESDQHISNTPWSGSITYRIQFVVTGTTTPKVINVAATTIDNDGSNACGGLKESVTFSTALNQVLTSASTTQVISGNTVTGPQVVQSGIGTGMDYANAALYVNVSEFNWTYSFASTGNCSSGAASEDRYGSLNLSCQVNFGRNFASATLSGNVYNDTDGLTDNQVDGTGTNAGGLFANLLDGNGFVVSSVAVAANGTYSFPFVVAGNYEVQISTVQGIESSAAPAGTLPAGWVNTGEFLGTGAGSDGAVNGRLPVTVGTASVSNANFGVEQRPTANNNTAPSQTNPGGTNSVTVPATVFSGSDPSPGTISSMRITAFPTNATTITINGSTFTSSNFPAGGVTVPANASGNPTQAVLVDPVDGAVTVGIPYVLIDNAGVAGSTAATASVPFTTVSISGTVFNDVNGATDNTVNGTGTNAGGLFANLLNASGNVVAVSAVAANGAFTFNGLNAGNYTVQISTNSGTLNNPAPPAVLPTGWVNTGEFFGAGAGKDGAFNGLLAVTVSTASVSSANFGIEQPPTPFNNTAPSQTNPGGTLRITVPAATFSATDPSPGVVTNINITTFPTNATSITVGTTTYYPNAGSIPGTCPTASCAAFPPGGVTIPTNSSGNPTQTVQVDPVDGAVTVGIVYVAIDNANLDSLNGATASVPFTTVSISGTVFNDVNGLTDNTVNGTGTNAGGLFANLLNSGGVVVAAVAVAANGNYSFSGLNAGNYTVQISSNQGTPGNSAPVIALPASWVNTGENLGAGAGSDGTANSLLAVTVGTASVSSANFGIEQRPGANSNMASEQPNMGGTSNSTVPPATFSGSDPSPGIVSSIRIVAFPSSATSITINGTQYTPATFPLAGVTIPANSSGNPTQAVLIDPVDGPVMVEIPFVTIDNAGVESASPGMASVPFKVAPTAAAANISGTLFSGGSPLRNALVVLTDADANSKTVTRTDANGNYFFGERQVGKAYIIQPLSGKYTFSPATSVVMLLDNAAGLNFHSTAKTYRPKNDFDGDGKSDVAVFRPSEGNWYVRQSSDGQMTAFKFGVSTDVPVSADFDGDGRSDYAVFRPSEGNWFIWQSETQTLRVENFGLSDDRLVPADFDGDGKSDVAVYRAGVWYIRQSSDGALKVKHFGLSDDKPVVEDFDGDGRADVSVYRPSDGNWYTLQSSSGAFSARKFGLSEDVPAAGDFDGDGLADIAQFRNGNWFVLASTTDFEADLFGTSDDQIVVGDYDGDGRADKTVYRNGFWSIRNSGDKIVRNVHFGLSTDIPIK